MWLANVEEAIYEAGFEEQRFSLELGYSVDFLELHNRLVC
jgi:hypothetical protein